MLLAFSNTVEILCLTEEGVNGENSLYHVGEQGDSAIFNGVAQVIEKRGIRTGKRVR